jgi:hypothetical protein
MGRRGHRGVDAHEKKLFPELKGCWVPHDTRDRVMDFIEHWASRTSARPRIISDNGPPLVARDFKEFIRVAGMTHVWTSPYDPQSNGKIERWHATLKADCIRPGSPLSAEDARRIITQFVEHYNQVRLHSAIGYVAPAAKLAGKEQALFADRDRKLLLARERRRLNRNNQTQPHLLTAQPQISI